MGAEHDGLLEARTAINDVKVTLSNDRQRESENGD
jgi:hypothetical protein